MRKEAFAAYLFLAPCILGLLIFEAGPVIASVILSLMDWDLLSPPKWVGLGNFREMFSKDKLVPLSLFNTAYYTFFGVPLQLAAALGAALLLNAKVRGIRLYRTAFYVPSVTPAVANAI
ncbi:MAG: carbohydrate ABC transporter permease, partial [Candidatus Zipacnadales bacterium]